MGTNCLSDDMRIQILSRLPPKSLLRFRCVSKSWCSLIDQHLRWRVLPSNMLGFLVQTKIRRNYTSEIQLQVLGGGTGDDDDDDGGGGGGGQVDKTFSFLPPRKLFLDHCSNGLFLCHSSSLPNALFLYRSSTPGWKDEYYYICNPATKVWANVPTPPDCWKWGFMFLAYDPCTSPHCKVLRISYSQQQFRIFSSQKGCWGDCKTTELPPDLKSCCDSYPVCHKGALYWKAESCFLIFDILEETFRCAALPDDAVNSFLGKLGGYICCASISIGENGTELRIWMLKSCPNFRRWQLKHSSRLNENSQKLEGRSIADAQIYAFHESLDVVFIKIGSKAFAYDLEKKELEILFSWGPIIYRRICFPYSPCWIDDWRTGDLKVATKVLP